jgi:hypothetical protein
MWATYGDDVQFFIVYIREAHALDSRSPMGGGGMPIVEDPVTQAERNKVAAVCMTKLALEPIPALVDDMDDTANDAYKAWPDRLYLVGRDGNIAYHGGPGPFEFKPDELEQAILKELGPDWQPKPKVKLPFGG